MNIIEALKAREVRIDNVRRWLVWSEIDNAWVVYGREYYARKTSTLAITEDEDEAIKWLLYEEEG